MLWLKKNWMLVVAGLVALGLLGASGGFLYTRYSRAATVQQSLEEQTRELERLLNMRPHPGNARVNNIDAARAQEEQIRALLQDARGAFAPIEYPTNLTSGQFNALLLKTIDELTRRAERSGVRLPPRFAFSFSNLRDQLSFEAKDIPPLTRQLAEIRTVTELLLQSRVLALTGIKRTAVAAQDTASTTPGTTGFMGAAASATGTATTDYWERKPVTNNVAILSPYEFTFHAFTPELSAFLEAIARSEHGLIVRNVAIDTVTSPLLASAGGPSADPLAMYGLGTTPPGIAGGGMDAGMAARYGLGGRGGFAPPGGAGDDRYGLGGGFGDPMIGRPRGPVTRGGRTILLEEHPFRARVWIYVLTPLPVDEHGRVIAPPPPPPAAPDPYADPFGRGGMTPPFYR